jgi:hypothetical protein
VLAGKGITTWHRTLASLAPAAAASRPGPPAASTASPLPAGLAAELIGALAAIALATP